MNNIFAILLSLAFIAYKFIFYPVYLSPLAKVPNAHVLSPLTSLWIHWRRVWGHEIQTVDEALQKHGPVVRLGPNELSVNMIDGGIRTIHGGGVEKTEWYDFFMNHGTRNTFSSLEGGEHLSRRRRSAAVYNKSSVQRSPHVRKILSTVLLERYMHTIYESVRTAAELDILDLDFAYGLDVVSAFIFGICRSTNFIENIEARKCWLATYSKSHPADYMFWLLELPNLTKWLTKVGISILPQCSLKAHNDLDQWALEMVDRAEKAVSDKPVAHMLAGDCPVLYNQLRLSLAAEQQREETRHNMAPSPRQRLQLASECLDHLVATRDTFGISLTCVLHDLSRHPVIQRELQAELGSIPQPFIIPFPVKLAELPPPEILESLPLLQAVIKESLRLRNTVPTANPRRTPPNRKTSIGPYRDIPAGVRISCFAWCLHRNQVVYPNPEEWDPQRWLGDPTEVEKREKWFWTWGSGSRICIGQSLAMEMLRYAVAAIYTNFSTSILDDECFGKDGSFVSGGPGDKLILKFIRSM